MFKTFCESINKRHIRLGVNLKTVTEKTDVLRQIKDKSVTSSPKIHKMLCWHLISAI